MPPSGVLTKIWRERTTNADPAPGAATEHLTMERESAVAVVEAAALC